MVFSYKIVVKFVKWRPCVIIFGTVCEISLIYHSYRGDPRAKMASKNRSEGEDCIGWFIWGKKYLFTLLVVLKQLLHIWLLQQIKANFKRKPRNCSNYFSFEETENFRQTIQLSFLIKISFHNLVHFKYLYQKITVSIMRP